MRTGKTEAAIDYNNSISKLLRIHLENFLKDEITLRTEINWLRLYLEVEQRRLQHSFHFEIHCRDEDMDELSIPPMLLQPIVENSIKHAFSNNGEGSIGKLTITIESPIENTYTVEIADTGKSDIQDNNRDDHQFKKSVAIENIKERIAILHKISPFSITLSALSRPAEFKTKLVIAYNLAH
jgi:LytS/YehU family sensor histidine kinase